MEEILMNTWQKYSNYRKRKNTDGSYTYIVVIDGEEIEVSEAVFHAYAVTGRKMKYMELDVKRDRIKQDPKSGKAVLDEHGQTVCLREREVSLEKMLDEDWDFPSTEPSPEDSVITAHDRDALYRCLGLLDDDEQRLINALFFKGMTEQEYANEIGLTQKAVNKRKFKVLGKLKKYFL
jgi:RNA polymerase sigma factor (sigma-70 family)